MAKRTSITKKDLEAKIAELEAKLASISSQAGGTAQTKTAPPPPKPQPKAEAPKPSEQKAAPPATLAQALENAWRNYATSNTHDYKTKTPGYSPGTNRYYGRRIAPAGTAPTQNWSLQKSKVPGYTQPSTQYFATRARLAYHPQDKMFAGYGLVVSGAIAQAKTQSAPPPPPPPRAEPQAQQTTHASSGSKPSKLETYERDYLARLEQQEREQAELMQAAQELAAKRRAESGGSSGQTSSKRGTLPQGF